MLGDLRTMLNNCQIDFDEDFAKKIFAMMVQAVAYCHSQGIIHRDLKLENFLVDFKDERSNEIVVKLADFGLSEKI